MFSKSSSGKDTTVDTTMDTTWDSYGHTEMLRLIAYGHIKMFFCGHHTAYGHRKMLLAIDTTQTPQRHHIGLLLTHFSSVDWKWRKLLKNIYKLTLLIDNVCEENVFVLEKFNSCN